MKDTRHDDDSSIDTQPPSETGDTFVPGSRVIDTTQPTHRRSPARVIDQPTETADEFYIPAIGKTVYEANESANKSDAVVGIAFENDLTRAFGDADVPSTVGPDEVLAHTRITIYHYPTPVLTTVSDDYEVSTDTRSRDESGGTQ